MMPQTTWFAVIATMLVVVAVGVTRERLRQRTVRATLLQSEEPGAQKHRALHPVIVHDLCQGCGNCVEACPEQGALQVIEDKAHLVDLTRCLGHGECEEACPSAAIELVV